MIRIPQFELVLILLAFALPADAASYYTQRLEDPKAVYVTSPGSGDATALLQQAINRVQETTGQGIVLLAEGRYRLTNTLFIWPGIRLIGCGATRPVIVLPASTPGFQDASREKVMFFFAGAGPASGAAASAIRRPPIPMRAFPTPIPARSIPRSPT